MDNSTTQQDIVNLLNNMAQGIENKRIADNIDWAREIVEKYQPESLSNVGTFDLRVNRTLEDKSRTVFDILYAQGIIGEVVSSKNKTLLTLLFMNYNLIKRHLGKFIRDVNGFSCSQDKVSFILQSFIAELQGKEVEWDATKFWVPNAGTKEQWHSLVEENLNLIYAMDYGERRLEIINEIKEAYAAIK